MQTVDWVQNAEWQFIYCFSSDSDNMSSYNLPSVTHQSLFRDHLLRSFALLGNIPCPFLNPSRSYYNFKPSYSLLTLRAVNWCNVSTDFTNLIKIDVDVDVNKMSRAIFEKQSTALHVVRTFHLLTDFMCSVCWQKCGPRPKLFLRLDIVSTFRGVHTLIFT